MHAGEGGQITKRQMCKVSEGHTCYEDKKQRKKIRMSRGGVKVWIYIDGWKSLPDLMTFQERLDGNEENMELLSRRVS